VAVHRVSAGVPARAARAAVFAAASVCLALAAHTAGGGGHPPPLVVMLAAVGLATRVCHGLAGREHGLAEITVGLGAGQFALHLTFTLAAPAVPAGAGAGGHGHLAATPHTAPGMLLAHALAAGVTVVALRRAERTLWAASALRSWLAGAGATALARFARLLAALGALAPTRRLSPARPVVPACPSTASRADTLIGRVNRRRGPPGEVETSSAVPDLAVHVAPSHG
jgi:hypothetical protein